MPVLGAIAVAVGAIVARVQVAGAWLATIGSAVWVIRLMIGAYAISAMVFDVSLIPNVAILFQPLQTASPTMFSMLSASGFFVQLNSILDVIAIIIGYQVAKATFLRSRQ